MAVEAFMINKHKPKLITNWLLIKELKLLLISLNSSFLF